MEFYVYFCEPVPTEDIKEHLFCVLRILMSWFQKRSVDVRYYLMGVMGSRAEICRLCKVQSIVS